MNPTPTQTVLLAEDDLLTRQVVSRLLRNWGYNVLEASDGRRAVSIMCWHPEPIDLLFTDVLMPELDGVQLASIAGVMRPGLKALYTSSAPDAVSVEHGVIQAGKPFIPKSAGPEELCQKIRELLEESPAQVPLSALITTR